MRTMTGVLLVTAVTTLAACRSDDGMGPNNEEVFVASMTGSAERPNPVTTNASGTATVRFNPATNTFTYTMNVSNITGVTAAHIHGPATVEQAAGIMVPLVTPSTPTVNGSFGAQQITVAGVSVDSLVALMRAGRTYVNVHTAANPGGEIRGQLVRQ
jgi:hypothetical protein